MKVFFTKYRTIIFIVFVIVYSTAGFFIVSTTTENMVKNYYGALESRAQDLAVITASAYKVSDKEVEELKKLDFKDAIKHPANKRLEELFKNSDNTSENDGDIKYAYVFTYLLPDDIKYVVTKEKAEELKVNEGRLMDLLWLVDVVVNKEERDTALKKPEYYDDINRYSVMRDNEINAYQKRKNTAIIVDDEYGKAFTGLAPLYTLEGNFVGMLGVDLYFESFASQEKKVQIGQILIFVLPTIFLTIIYLLIYLEKNKISNLIANTDPLTGVFNRRYLAEALPLILQHAYKNNENISIIMLDIDFFKNYNDYYGHQMGDTALTQIAKEVSSVVRHNQDVICRYGGEEFLVILPNASRNIAIMVAQKIKDKINQLRIPHEKSSINEFVTVSQGIYSCRIDTLDEKIVKQVVQKADKALYKAKSAGRNCFVVYNDDWTKEDD